MKIQNILKNKSILFITTKNTDYIRNTQEIEMLKNCSDTYRIIGSSSKHYFVRLIKVYFLLIFMSYKKYDTIFVGFAPQLILPFFHWRFKKKYIIQDFFISLYDTFCCDRKIFKSSGLTGKLLHHLDSKTLSLSDVIISDTKAHAKFFVDEFGAIETRLCTLYLEASLSNIENIRLITTNNKNIDYTVIYFGSVLPLQGTDIILSAIDIVTRIEPHIHFIFIGPLPKNILNTAPKNEQINYINWLDQSELYSYIKNSDLCLAGHFSNHIDKAKRTIPGKAFIYSALKKPMILGDNPANHELFTEDNASIYYVEMGNPEALAAKIISIYNQSNSF